MCREFDQVVNRPRPHCNGNRVVGIGNPFKCLDVLVVRVQIGPVKYVRFLAADPGLTETVDHRSPGNGEGIGIGDDQGPFVAEEFAKGVGYLWQQVALNAQQPRATRTLQGALEQLFVF